MERIPQPVFLPGTPESIISTIMYSIRFFYEYEGGEFPGERKQVENQILLGTHPYMPKVWEKIKQLESQSTNGSFDKACSDFDSAISSALYRESPWAELKPTARATKYAQIIDTMQQLAKDIKHYDLDQHEQVLNLFNSNEGANITLNDDTPDMGNLGNFTSYRDIYDNQLGIQISDLLQKHADKLEQQERHLTPLTSKTTGERGLLHFIRTLAIHNKARYGEYHGAIISRVASVYFPNSETEPEKIRASIHALNL